MRSARLTYSHFLILSTTQHGTGGIASDTTTVGGLGKSTAPRWSDKVSVRLKGVAAKVLLRGKAVPRDESTGRPGQEGPEDEPVMR